MRNLLAVVVLTNLLSAPASSTVIVSVIPDSTSVLVGDVFNLSLTAVATDPILGFGIDLMLPTQLQTLGAPTIGASWIPLSSPDGDGLAAYAFPTALSGSLHLATISVVAVAPGIATVQAAATPGDLTEGFPLDPAGFDTDVTYGSTSVLIAPEPELLLQLAFWLTVVLFRFGLTRSSVTK